MSEWQDMSTAPKDGSLIVVWYTNWKRYEVMRWRPSKPILIAGIDYGHTVEEGWVPCVKHPSTLIRDTEHHRSGHKWAPVLAPALETA